MKTALEILKEASLLISKEPYWKALRIAAFDVALMCSVETYITMKDHPNYKAYFKARFLLEDCCYNDLECGDLEDITTDGWQDAFDLAISKCKKHLVDKSNE